MKRVLVIILALTVISWGDVFQRLPLIETYVSPTCGACTNFCRTMDSLYFPDYVDSMVFVVYMSGFSPADERIAYYSSIYDIGGVPWTALDGEDEDHLVAESVFERARSKLDSLPVSPIGFRLIGYSPDSVEIEVYTDSTSYEGNYLLFGLVVLDSVDEVHSRVCTEFLTSQTGSLITVNAGEPLQFQFPLHLDFSIPPERYSAVFFLKTVDSPEIINAYHTSMRPREPFDFAITSPKFRYLVPVGIIQDVPVRVLNWGTHDDTYHLALWTELPPGWEAYFPPGELAESLRVRAFGDTVINFEIVIPSPGRGQVILTAESDSIPGRVDTLRYEFISGAELLLVCDSPTPEDSFKYQVALDELGVDYVFWDEQRDPKITDLEGVAVDKIIWFCGEDTVENIVGEERIALERYLEDGGSLLLAGSGIGRANEGAMLFFRDVLSAEFEGVIASPTSVRGSSFHIFAGFSGGLSDIHTAETYAPADSSPGITVLTYPDGSGAGVATDYPGKSIIVGFPPEKFDQPTLTDFIRRCLWFMDEGFSAFYETKPGKCNLAISPNPFNSTCRIEVPSGTYVEIYDISGNLVFARRAEGAFIWRPNLPAGIYLLRAEFPTGEVAEQKVLFVK